MSRNITVRAEFSGVLPTASYANMRPGFMAEETFTLESVDQETADRVIAARQQELQAICYRNFEAEALKARVIKIQEDLKSFRFYTTPDGDKYPSVTSVCGYDKDFFVSDDDLIVYAAQGNIIDAEIRNFVKTGVYKQSKDLLECTADRFILKSRKLASGKYLALEGWNFTGFLEKYPIKDLRSIESPVFNSEHRYAGTPDLVGIYNELPTLVSIKRTKSETDNLTQDSAYAKCAGMEEIKQIMVVEMKAEADGGNKQGWSRPIISTEIDKYFELFLRKRSDVKKLYGV